MIEKKKFYKGPSNVVYTVDGSSYGASDDIVDAIRRSVSKRLESKNLDIPRLPHVASKILELSQNPNVDVDEIARTITTDPVLVTRVLTVANSAALGSGRTVEGVMPAIMRLGLKSVRDMVFAESIRLKVFSGRSYRSILEQSWKLSIGTAVASEVLSSATGVERDGAFLMGLLHDTGKPVLVMAVSEIEKQNQNRALGEEMVEILMSQLHEEIGGYVLESWGMSPAVVTAARSHHRYRTSAATPPLRLIYASNLICQHLGIGAEQREIDFTIEHVFSELNLADESKMTPILEKVQNDVQGLMAA